MAKIAICLFFLKIMICSELKISLLCVITISYQEIIKFRVVSFISVVGGYKNKKDLAGCLQGPSYFWLLVLYAVRAILLAMATALLI